MNYSNNSSNTCNGTKYVIKKGDTLYSISRRYNVPLALVLRANPYVDVYNLQVGDEICVPGEQNSSVPTRPPVITGPGPVIIPRDEDREQTERRTETVETAPVPAAVREETAQTDPVQTAPMMQSPSQSQPARREIGSRNTFNIHYYNGASAPSDEAYDVTSDGETDNRMETGQRSMPARRTENVIQRRTQPMTPTRPASPARRATQVRQTTPARRMETRTETMPARQPMPTRETVPARQPMPMRETVPMRETMPARQPMPMRTMMPEQDMEPITKRAVMPVQQRPASMSTARTLTKARMVTPVRIIAQPASDEEQDRCAKWNCYQDRERFNTIMYNAEKMSPDCCSKICTPSCTENIAKPLQLANPMQCDTEGENESSNMTMISYICREGDSLQDILDYFMVDLEALLYYNGPNVIKLKPGCIIMLPGRGEDR